MVDYAQDLNRLHQKAFPPLERGSEHAEKVGQTAFTYKFTVRVVS